MSRLSDWNKLSKEKQRAALTRMTPEARSQLDKDFELEKNSSVNTSINIGGLNFPMPGSTAKVSDEVIKGGEKVLNEVAMGGGGELIGSLAKAGGGSYTKARDAFDKDVKEFEKDHPILSPTLTGLSMAGQVVATGGLGAVGQAAKIGVKEGLKTALKSGAKIGVKEGLKTALKSGAKIGSIAGALGAPSIIEEKGINKEKILPAVANTITGTAVGAGFGGVLGGIPAGMQYAGKKEVVQNLMSGVYKKTVGKLKTIFGPNWQEKTVTPLLTELEGRGKGRIKSISQLEDFTKERATAYNTELGKVVKEGTGEALGITGKEIVEAAEDKLSTLVPVSEVAKALKKEIAEFKEHVSISDELRDKLSAKKYDFLFLDDIRQVKNTYGQEIYRGKLNASDAYAAQAKEYMREIAGDAMTKVAKESANPKLAEKVAYLNNKENTMLNNVKLLSKSGEEKAGFMEIATTLSPATFGGLAGFALGGAPGIAAGLAAGITLKKYGPQMASKLAEKAPNIIGPTRQAAKFLTIGGARQTTKKD